MIVTLDSLPENEKLLLHTCCGACLNASLNVFLKKKVEVKLFYYNPNIHPYSEYLRRKQAVLAYLKERDLDIKLLPQSYDLETFFRNTNGFESYPERCRFCYRIRMIETARVGFEEGYRYFSTTILSSPYQLHEVALEEASRAAEMFDLHVVDFKIDKKDYRLAVEEFKSMGFYYQNYCGCVYSEVERLKGR